jgi:hypothetical protein
MPKTATPTPTKTPAAAYTRALRALGLRQGLDFTVRTRTPVGEAAYASAELRTPMARLAVAQHLDQVRDAVAAAGWSVGFHAYERGDLAMGGHLHTDALHWVDEVFRINTQAVVGNVV